VCIDLHQTRSVVAGSDHLQLIKLWLHAPPGRGSAAGWKFLASTQCLHLSECFFHLYMRTHNLCVLARLSRNGLTSWLQNFSIAKITPLQFEQNQIRTNSMVHQEFLNWRTLRIALEKSVRIKLYYVLNKPRQWVCIGGGGKHDSFLYVHSVNNNTVKVCVFWVSPDWWTVLWDRIASANAVCACLCHCRNRPTWIGNCFWFVNSVQFS